MRLALTDCYLSDCVTLIVACKMYRACASPVHRSGALCPRDDRGDPAAGRRQFPSECQVYGGKYVAIDERPTMPAECVLIQAPLGPEDVVRVAATVDCIINSANNNLLTPGVSGIAGALLAAGGPELLEASDAARQAAGGEVAIGSAVATGGGRLPCGIVHAVGMGYRSRGTKERERFGRRVLASADSVEQALGAALLIAAENGWRSAATKIMCARPGYSVYSDKDAPLIMLAAMRRAVCELPPDCTFEQLQIYIPLETLELVGAPPCLEPKDSIGGAGRSGASTPPANNPEPKPNPMGDASVALYPDASSRLSMVSAALHWSTLRGPDPDAIALGDTEPGGRFLTRGVHLEFLIGPEAWVALLYEPVSVASNSVVSVGRSSLTRQTLLVHGAAGEKSSTPILRVDFTVTHVNASSTKSEPMSERTIAALRAAGAVDARSVIREPWSGPPSEGAFEWRLTARWTEMDGNGHINQKWYGIWMEEARCMACEAGGYGVGAPLAGGRTRDVSATAPPTRMQIDYRGQARAGDALVVLTWWDGEAFCFEVARDETARELLATGRTWCEKTRTKM